jgi:hypothetical protein
VPPSCRAQSNCKFLDKFSFPDSAREIANQEVLYSEAITILSLTPTQQTAWWYSHFGPEGVWSYVLKEKYAEWRPAEPGEEGIPCEAEVYAG